MPGPGGGSELSLRRRREDGGSQGGRSWGGGGGGTAQGPEQGAPARGLPRSPSAPVTMSSRGRLGLQDAPTQPHPHRSMRAAAEGHRRLSLDTDLSRQGAHSWHAGAVALSERGPLRSQEAMSVTRGPWPPGAVSPWPCWLVPGWLSGIGSAAPHPASGPLGPRQSPRALIHHLSHRRTQPGAREPRGAGTSGRPRAAAQCGPQALVMQWERH